MKINNLREGHYLSVVLFFCYGENVIFFLKQKNSASHKKAVQKRDLGPSEFLNLNNI